MLLIYNIWILRWQDAENRRKQYKNFYRDRLFPLLTERYLTKYGGSFPLSGRSDGIGKFTVCNGCVLSAASISKR